MILVFSLKALDTEVGRVMGVQRWCPLLHSVITFRIAYIILLGALLSSAQLERTSLSFSHVLPPL